MPKRNRKKVEHSRQTEQNHNQMCELSVDGMHCAACEILIEKKLLKNFKNIDSVDASLEENKVVIYYDGAAPTLDKINNLFEQDKYHFSDGDVEAPSSGFSIDDSGTLKVNVSATIRKLAIFGIATGILLLLWAVEDVLQQSGKTYTGIESLLQGNISWGSTVYLTILTTGIVAGFSSCASLVGGLLLSMSKQWHRVYTKDGDRNSKIRNALPYIMFNLGRVLLFPLFGGLLGAVGNFFNLSIELNALLIIAVGILMFALGAQMVGLPRFRNFRVTLPRFITRRIADEERFDGVLFPFSAGALTFFIPCGFTTLAQALALVTGDFRQGALVMFLFALGTLPSLAIISGLSLYSQKSLRLTGYLGEIMGYVVIALGLININSQFKILGVPDFSYVGNFFTLIELIIFLTILITMIRLVLTNLRKVADQSGPQSLFRFILALLYILFIISFLTSYTAIKLPWDYTFNPIN